MNEEREETNEEQLNKLIKMSELMDKLEADLDELLEDNTKRNISNELDSLFDI